MQGGPGRLSELQADLSELQGGCPGCRATCPSCRAAVLVTGRLSGVRLCGLGAFDGAGHSTALSGGESEGGQLQHRRERAPCW